MKSQKMLLIVTDAGRIVGAAGMASDKKAAVNTAIVPLPGQQIHEVEVPEEIARLKSGHEFYMALSHAKFNPGTRRLIFPNVTFKKIKH